MKYDVFKERDNTVYCFGHPIGLDLPKMLSPTAFFMTGLHELAIGQSNKLQMQTGYHMSRQAGCILV
jgi:hypothetical protein